MTIESVIPEVSIERIENPLDFARSHLLPPEIHSRYLAPSPLDIPHIKNSRKFRPGAVLAATTLEGLMEDFGVADQNILVPLGHRAFNNNPEINPGSEYGLGLFEGMRLVPVFVNGRFIGASIPLFNEKIARLHRSLQGRLMHDRIDVDVFRQLIIATAAANAESIIWENNQPTWAYIRPSVNVVDGPLGVKITPEHIVRGNIVAFRWRDYVDVEKAFSHGLTVVGSPFFQRTIDLTGKYSSSYGEAGVVASLARKIPGADEAFYFSWGIVENGQFRTVLAQEGPEARNMLLQKGLILDGPGEDFGFFAGKTLILIPPGYGQLGGTNINYIAGPIAEELGLEVVHDFVTPEDIRKGRVDGAIFGGNAITGVPVREILLYPGLPDPKEKPEVLQFPILNPYAVKVAKHIRGELYGEIWPTAGKNFHTFVDLEAGNIIRDYLTREYRNWY